MSESIYITGLGKGRSINAQRRFVTVLNRFRSPENKIHFFDSRWETNESYDAKYQRLVTLYNEVRPRKVRAISAGASLAVRLVVEHPEIELAQLICGKVTGSEKIGANYQARAPAFVTAVQHSETLVRQGVDANRFVCYIPRNESDGVIEGVDMVVPNAPIVDLPPLTHSRAIAYAMLRYVTISNN